MPPLFSRSLSTVPAGRSISPRRTAHVGSSWSAPEQCTARSPLRFRIYPKPTRERLILACPQSAYGEGERASEALCAAYSAPGGLECAIARPFAFVGPHLALDQGFAIGDFIRCALASQPIAIRGDPSTMRSYLYTADLTVWLWTILSRAAPLRPYNVGSDQAISLGALAEEVASVLCPGMPVQIASSSRPGAAGSRYIPDIKRSTEELGLHQTIFLRDAIRRTAEWHGWRNGSSLQREGAVH